MTIVFAILLFSFLIFIHEFTGKVNSEITGTQALYFTYSGEGYIDCKSFSLK